jgi:hypothetical protein
MSQVRYGTVTFQVNKNPWLDLAVDIPFCHTDWYSVVIGFLKIQSDPVCIWYDIVHQYKRKDGNNGSREEIGNQDPVEAHPAADNGNEFCSVGHPGRKIYNGNKGEQGAEQYCKIRHEIQVILGKDINQCGVVIEEIVNLLRKIKDDGN